jgi:hypothetical protein
MYDSYAPTGAELTGLYEVDRIRQSTLRQSAPLEGQEAWCCETITRWTTPRINQSIREQIKEG